MGNFTQDVGNGAIFDMDLEENANYQIQLYIKAGVTVDNIVFKPMLLKCDDNGNPLGDETYEIYKGNTITVDSTTELPVCGLNSYEDITNVFNEYDAPITVSYAKSDTGKLIMNSTTKVNELKSNLSNSKLVVINNIQNGTGDIRYCIRSGWCFVSGYVAPNWSDGSEKVMVTGLPKPIIQIVRKERPIDDAANSEYISLNYSGSIVVASKITSWARWLDYAYPIAD